MNENTEKNNQNTPLENNADTKAFKWEFDGAKTENQPETTEAQLNSQNKISETIEEITPNKEPAASEEAASDEEADRDLSQGEEPAQDNDPSPLEKTAPLTKEEIKKSKREGKKTRRYSTRALVKESNIAIILSAIAILLLAATTVLIAFGIIPTDRRVVFVHTSSLGPVSTSPYEATPELIEEVKNSVVILSVKKKSGSAVGSGIIVTKNGYIVTNYHVVENATDITVTLYNSNEKLPARVIGYSERDDIAVIKANAEDLRPATFANSEDCRTGERVYSIGAPEGAEFGWTVTQGIISNPVREIKIYSDEYILEKKLYLLQTDAPVNPGNSGGPLINVRGEVVGIITLKRSDAVGLGFALPSSASLELIEAIIETGNIDSVTSKISKGRPLIGIVGVGLEADTWYRETSTGVEKVTAAYAAANPDKCIRTDVAGVYVTSLNPNLDAYNHLKIGDVITKVNDTNVYITYDIMDVVNEFDGGDTVEVTYVRNGETFTVCIVLEEE